MGGFIVVELGQLDGDLLLAVLLCLRFDYRFLIDLCWVFAFRLDGVYVCLGWFGYSCWSCLWC